jgi:hypothetical protein
MLAAVWERETGEELSEQLEDLGRRAQTKYDTIAKTSELLRAKNSSLMDECKVLANARTAEARDHARTHFRKALAGEDLVTSMNLWHSTLRR